MKTSLLKTKVIAIACGVLSTFFVTMASCSLANAQELSDGLGRLFFTPERRQILDRQRQLNIQEKQETPEEPTMTINGIVTRSSGKRTAWVNGISQNENETPNGLSVTPVRKYPGKVILKNDNISQEKASVGDTINRTTGESTDLLNGGEIRIHTKPSARN